MYEVFVAKEKRTKLEPSGKKVTFVGYRDTSKAYKIYIPRQCQIEVSRDVIFDEEVALMRSSESHMDIDSEEQEDPKDESTNPCNPFVHPSYYEEESVEPAEPVDLPRDVAVTKKRPAWFRETLQDTEGHAAPSGSFR
jgi:hypothetical protein